MQIFGVDFTSVPSRSKPITCASGALEGRRLAIIRVDRLTSFAAFEAFLKLEGPWVAAVDFPFGQPRQFLSNLEWPTAWPEYVARFGSLLRNEFRTLLEAYKAPRADGDREYLRLVDKRAKSQSPMKLY